MNTFRPLILIALLSLFGAMANANSSETDLGLTQEQAKILFNSFSIESETATPESYGTAIYGVRYRRLSGKTACDKIVFDIEDLENKYSCSIVL